MEKNLFALSKEQYRFERKIIKLRQKIQDRTAELNITTNHTQDAHFYCRDGQEYKSVSSKSGLLKDQGVANWKLARAMDYIFQHFPEINNENILEYLDKAKKAPQLEFENAGNIGREVHGWREEWFGRIIKGDERDSRLISSSSPPVISCCRAIQKFVSDYDYHPIACELYLADHKFKLGGTLDDIGFVGGELSLVDLKTSNIGDKNSYFHQVALYYLMFWRLYKIRIKKFYILHVSKTDGTYNLIEIKNMPQLIKEAKLVLKLSDALDRLTESKKKERVVYGQ